MALVAVTVLATVPLTATGASGRTVVHRVRSGDTLIGIARRYRLQGPSGWRRIYRANPRLRSPRRLTVGRRLRVPGVPPRARRTDTRRPRRRQAAASRSQRRITVWDRLAACESGGRWSLNTGNGYYGGLQFHPQTWRAFGGRGRADRASRARQIEVARRVKARQGWGAWPGCSRKLGLR